MKWLLAGAVAGLIGIGSLIYVYILFQGPRMQVQEHIRSYQRIMPLPPEGVVPIEPDLFALPKLGQSVKNPLPDRHDVLERGKVYYNYYCVFCHGENGQGDGPVGYSYMPAPSDLHAPGVVGMSDSELMQGMLLGIGHEPVLSGVVMPDHRWYLVSYVRALGKAPRLPAENYGSHVILKGPETR